MLWQSLYDVLSAIEAIGVCRQGPGLNKRGERALRYLQTRRHRASKVKEKEKANA